MRIARFLVTPELLFEQFPRRMVRDMRLLSAQVTPSGCVEFCVEHPDLKDVSLQEGEAPPLARPSFRKNEAIDFIGWGQD